MATAAAEDQAQANGPATSRGCRGRLPDRVQRAQIQIQPARVDAAAVAVEAAVAGLQRRVDDDLEPLRHVVLQRVGVGRQNSAGVVADVVRVVVVESVLQVALHAGFKGTLRVGGRSGRGRRRRRNDHRLAAEIPCQAHLNTAVVCFVGKGLTVQAAEIVVHILEAVHVTSVDREVAGDAELSANGSQQIESGEISWIDLSGILEFESGIHDDIRLRPEGERETLSCMEFELQGDGNVVRGERTFIEGDPDIFDVQLGAHLGVQDLGLDGQFAIDRIRVRESTSEAEFGVDVGLDEIRIVLDLGKVCTEFHAEVGFLVGNLGMDQLRQASASRHKQQFFHVDFLLDEMVRERSDPILQDVDPPRRDR